MLSLDQDTTNASIKHNKGKVKLKKLVEDGDDFSGQTNMSNFSPLELISKITEASCQEEESPIIFPVKSSPKITLSKFEGSRPRVEEMEDTINDFLDDMKIEQIAPNEVNPMHFAEGKAKACLTPTLKLSSNSLMLKRRQKSEAIKAFSDYL